MDRLIRGTSPRFKAPRPGWALTRLGGRPPAGDGRLRLRVGYCRGPELKTVAERMEALQRRRRAGDPVASAHDLRSSLVPVVLVDGRPVASGWGSIELPLAAGRHLLEVQSQHSRAWRAIDIHSGRVTAIDYIGMLGEAHRAYGDGDPPPRLADFHGHTIGPRGRLNFWQYLPANARSRMSFVIVLIALAVAGLGSWFADILGAPTTVAVLAGAALWAGALAAWGLRVLWTYLRYNRCPPAPPLRGAGQDAPLVLDPDGDVPDPRPGAAAILIDARFLKTDLDPAELARQLPPGASIDRGGRAALDSIGEITPIKHRFAVPPPKIELDRISISTTWTRMWIEVLPGHHRLDVRTPEPPLPAAEQLPPDTGAVEIDLAAGQVAAIRLTVAVKAVPDRAEPALHHWSCRIERLESAPEPTPGPTPRADIRGGLRRAATGRWWERPQPR